MFGYGDEDNAYYWTQGGNHGAGAYWTKEKVGRYSWIRPVVSIPVSDLS